MQLHMTSKQSLKVIEVITALLFRIYGFHAPESLSEDSHGNLYTGLENGKIVRIAPSPVTGELGKGRVLAITEGTFPNFSKTLKEARHGRPLGV